MQSLCLKQNYRSYLEIEIGKSQATRVNAAEQVMEGSCV
jgi:hypothetical protein